MLWGNNSISSVFITRKNVLFIVPCPAWSLVDVRTFIDETPPQFEWKSWKPTKRRITCKCKPLACANALPRSLVAHGGRLTRLNLLQKGCGLRREGQKGANSMCAVFQKRHDSHRSSQKVVPFCITPIAEHVKECVFSNTRLLSQKGKQNFAWQFSSLTVVPNN